LFVFVNVGVILTYVFIFFFYFFFSRIRRQEPGWSSILEPAMLDDA